MNPATPGEPAPGPAPPTRIAQLAAVASTDPVAAPAARTRYPARLIIGGLLAVAVAGLVAGEATGWPFLAVPLAHGLSAAIGRRVRLLPVDPDLAASPAEMPQRFRVRFLGSLRITAPVLEIAAPAWSAAPHLLRAHQVSLEIAWSDLWRALDGQLLRIRRLEAARLDAHAERLADGRASWQLSFGAAADARPGRPVSVPDIDELLIRGGTTHYRDEAQDTDLQIHSSLVDAGAAARGSAASGAATGPSGAPAFELDAQGRYLGLPLQLELRSAGVLPWLAAAAPFEPVALHLTATIGRAHLEFDGEARDALRLAGVAGRFSLSGPSLSAVGDLAGLSLPMTVPLWARGTVAGNADRLQVRVAEAAVGGSRLNGDFVLDRTGPGVPRLSGRLGGPRLLLADLGPMIGVPVDGRVPVPVPNIAAAPGQRWHAAAQSPAQATTLPLAKTGRGGHRVLPDRPFDLAAFRAMDADVAFTIDEFDLGSASLQPLRPLSGRLLLHGGVLSLQGIQAGIGQGSLGGDIGLDARGTVAAWTAELHGQGVHLERWIRQPRAPGKPPYVSGELNGHAVLTGRGLSAAGILAGLNGTLRAELREGAVSHLAVVMAGLDLAHALGLLIRGDDRLAVRCAIAELQAADGVLRSTAMVLDTAASAIWIEGSLSLADETLDLRAVVNPKAFSPLTLRTPLRLRGGFDAPELLFERGPLAGKLASSALLALLNPFAALAPLVDPGDGAAANRAAARCQALARQGRLAVAGAGR